ncbi:baseplate wedge subunit [Synechococcus phage S-H9-1]|uniref:Structural protein n=1 Tax=Synechococcus phage S-H9-1 TaxID=2783674 RepID=A0A873WT31_9CAUD|nr:baseplate wedge subunit [Synechococcus phage S-H9-1]QPB08254.1 structural protein [Synechococcus phage S-H9-1]
MSFNINSDKEFIRGNNPKLIGDNELTVRIGTGSLEREILRTEIDANTGLPRVGINRTGERVNNIEIISGGSGYTLVPSVIIDPPTTAGGTQALASAFIFNGRVTSIAINNPGSGYTSTPNVVITGGNGAGASAQAFLDTVDFELDINGAIRTSTSIISDTARILNLDIDNFVTPDLEMRAPDLKTYMNNTGTIWDSNVIVQKDAYRYFGSNVYQALNGGETGSLAPEHTDGIELNGEVNFKHIGFRVVDQSAYAYNETGESGIFPRSITPLLGDRSDKIATTEYVLNLATNDVGGRIYVSEQIGSDLNDGRSAVAPVRTIKKAAQLAWATPGVKETIIVSGGDYLEDNPISLPPDASIVGDNLRLVIIRPRNPGKHIMKFGDKNYIIGVTYRDQIDSNGDPVATWDFAMVFDDKQRIVVDYEVNGDFGVEFPIGHQIFGPDQFQVGFQQNTGLAQLQTGVEVVGVNTGARANVIGVDFATTTGASAYVNGSIDIELTSGSFVEGEQFRFITSASTGNSIALTITQTSGANKFITTTNPSGLIAGGSYIFLDDADDSSFTSGYYEVVSIVGNDPDSPTEWEVTVASLLNSPSWDSNQAETISIFGASVVSYTFDTTSLESIRAEGEVVSVDDDITATLPIQRIDFSQQGSFTDGFQSEQFGNSEDLGGIVFYTNELVGRSNIHDFKEGQEILIQGLPTTTPDLSFLNGKQRIYKVIEDADGRARRFVIPKKAPAINDANFDPGQFATVSTFSRSITLSLLNSPNTFPLATPVDRRYQDACVYIRNNRDFIADEVVGRINDEFKKEYFAVYDVSGNDFKIYLGTSRFEHTYDNTNPTGTVTFGGNTYNITDFIYDASVTGVATITTDVAIPSLVEDDTVQLAGLEVECDNGTKVYPSFNIPVSDEQCKQDIVHFLNAIVRDLEFGSNHNIIEAAKKYIVGAKIDYVENEIIQTVRAIEYARELAIYAMCNWRTGNRTGSDPVYTPQYSSLPRYFDDSVITSTALLNADGTANNSGYACDDVRSAIDTLSYLWVDVIANDASGTYLDAAYLIARNRDLIADVSYKRAVTNYPSLGLNNVDERKCRRDINYILSGLIRDLVLGGNSGIVTAAEAYYSGSALAGIPTSELAATRYAFQQARDLSILAMRNWVDASGASYTFPAGLTDIPQYTDSSILADPSGNPLCANVESSITTIMGTLDGILEFADDPNSPTAIEPGSTTITTGTLFDTSLITTYPDSYIYDLNNVRMAVRGIYDDYPIIEASPYTQNSSVISFLGGSGALVDGSKVKQPNCPFPGLELDGTATYPNQGKSMVASAFTIVSFGGTGYKVIEDGYTQLVSVFVIFCADGVLAESGGYCSITNSATNFGIYALRGIGYRREAYEFDVATITNVSATPTGRTIFNVDGLGREPLEHYVVKIDGIENTNPDIEYFIDAVGAVGAGPPFAAELTIDDGQGQPMDLTDSATGLPISTGSLTGYTIRLHRPSIVNSSSHTWEFAGSGTNYLALPENGGTKIEAYEQVSEDYGRVYVSGTDELGDFKVGTFARIENRTGAITFTGTVTISEVEFLKLKGGDVVVTGFSADNTLGGAGTSNSVLPTQKAVRDYITNNLGPYINKPYSTNAVPRALVELTDSGKISVDQIPALRPFEVYTVANQSERLALEGALAGDIAIQADTSTSFILNNDLDSLFAAFVPDPTLQFTIGDIFTGSLSGGRIQATEYRQGVVYQLNITDGGSGYTQPPTVTISGTLQQGGVEAKAITTIANGEVVTLSIVLYNGFIGGKGYTAAPTVTIAAPAGSGTQATAVALIESRLYGDIVNRISLSDTDTFESSDIPAETVNITRIVNTSASNSNNWVSLSSNQIAASDITSGVIETDRLATGGAANSFTFLRGDQNWALAVQSLKGAEVRYFDKLYSTASSGSSQLTFQTNSDVLIGHEVVNSINGIQANTNITGVITAAGLTTISLNNPLTQTINAGTIIEFERGASPVVFESSYTQGNFVDDIIIANGGSGFTDGQYFDVELDGGTGTGLKANIIVTSNTVTEITVTSGGSGYNNDFSITNPPVEIGSGSSLVLEAKISTVNRQYANVSIDVQRVTDLTISSDLYGTIGVSRFKKDQFNIGSSGNGSIELKTGPGSGLDADLLDTKQGSFYLNSSNQNAGTLPTDRLAGTYNISVSGSSGNTIRLATGTNNPTSNPTPNNFVEGLVANTINNSADQLNDGGSQHLVLTIRNKGQGLTAEGGVRQMAFTDNDNIYLRGSGTGVTAFGSWAKMWTSLNDGIGSGLDADRLDGRQGTWYQNALNINSGTVSDNRLPRFISATKFRDTLTVQSFNGDPKYRIYISGRILNTTPFTPGSTVKLYDSSSQSTGEITIDNLVINDDTSDNTNDYTIIIGRLITGNFIGALTIGTASNREEFQDFTIDDDNVIEVASLESDGGTANLRLGRADGQATSPAIYFTSAQLAPTSYNAAIIATGGNATDGSGTLNILVANANGLNVNGNVVWNSGNIEFQTSNIANTAVKRDANGNFAAGTITADLIGSASENVLVAGDDMTGRLRILNVPAGSQALSVSGITDLLSSATVADDFTVDSGTLFVDASNDNVRIAGGTGGTNANYKLTIAGFANGQAGKAALALGSGNNSSVFDTSQILLGYNAGFNYKHAIKTRHNSGGSGEGNAIDFYTWQPGQGAADAPSNHVISMTGRAGGSLGIGVTDPSYNLHVDGTAYIDDALTVQNSITIDTDNDNSGAPLIFRGSSSYRNFRIGNQIIGNHFFSIQASTNNGGTSWNTTPAIAVDGSNNRVSINTTVNSSTATGSTVTYGLNVQGNFNVNGLVYQNNQPFVTSRWTEAPNGSDIFRLSKVGINRSGNPRYDMDVDGDINTDGTIRVNQDAMYLDTYGIFKMNRQAIAENVTVPNGSNCVSAGPVIINNGYTVTISNGSNWSVI